MHTHKQVRTLLLFTKSESPVNVPLLDLWLRELRITDYQLAYHTQAEAYAEWKGPCLAFGGPAINAATRAEIAYVFVPMPFKNLHRLHDDTPRILGKVQHSMRKKGWWTGIEGPKARLNVIREGS